MTTQNFPFISATLDSLIPPASGFDVARDSYSPYLQLYITSNGAKTFFVRKRVNGKDTRKILGNYPDMDIDNARSAALAAVKKMSMPSPTRRGDITLKAAFQNYLKDKVRRTAESKQKLQRSGTRLWAEILPLKLSEITTDNLKSVHHNIAENSGKSTANRMKETLSAVFDYANETGYKNSNPAAKLTKFAEKKSTRFLSPGEFMSIYKSVAFEKNQTMRAALKMLAYGFTNKSKILAMKWDDLDLNQNTWNGRPLSNHAVVLLESLPQKSKFVFPNTGGKSGHLVDPKRAWRRVLGRTKITNAKITDIYKTLCKMTKSVDGSRRHQMNEVLDNLGI